jgi:hypothetical protein
MVRPPIDSRLDLSVTAPAWGLFAKTFNAQHSTFNSEGAYFVGFFDSFDVGSRAAGLSVECFAPTGDTDSNG